MARLTAKTRRKLPKSAFAIPGKRKYPIKDRAHARAALSFVSRYGTASEKSTVRRKVAKKFGMGPAAKKRTTRRRSPSRRRR